MEEAKNLIMVTTMASYDQIAKNNWRYRISLGKIQKRANMNTSLKLALNVNQTLNIKLR